LSALSGFALVKAGAIQNEEIKEVTQHSSLWPKDLLAQSRGKQTSCSSC